MKKLKTLMLVAVFATLITACKRHSTIIETGKNYYLRIEYAGRVNFNDDLTAIRSISPGGYVKFEQNERKMIARNDGNGGVEYELEDNGYEMDPKTEGKQFITSAVRTMVKKGYYPK